MRKTAITLLALGLAAALVTPAFATQYLSEAFPYPNGALGSATAATPNATTGWYTHSGTGGTLPNDIAVSSGVAVGLMSNSPDDSKNFSQVLTATDKVYGCFLCTIPTPGTLPVVTNYFAHFKGQGTATNFVARVYVGPGTDNSHFKFGITTQNTVASIQWWATDLNFDQQYTIAIAYDASNGVSNLWVNPVNETSTNLASTDPLIGSIIGAFALRESTSGLPSGTSNWGYKVDQIGCASTFDEACVAGPTPANTPTWGKIKSLYR